MLIEHMPQKRLIEDFNDAPWRVFSTIRSVMMNCYGMTRSITRCKCPFHDDKINTLFVYYFPKLHDLSLLRLWRAWLRDKAIRREFLASGK